MSRRHCSGCGRPDTRIDACPACRAAGRWPPGAPAPASPPSAPPGAKRSIVGWRLTWVPFGAERPTTLATALATADAGEQVAERYNRLDWQEHVGLGADALIAVPRAGAFILQPMAR